MIRKLLIVASCLIVFGISVTRAQAPVPDFSASVTSGCGPLDVQFIDHTTNGPLFWTWDFGNGQTSSIQNPSVTYNTPGVYTVTLIAKNRTGSDAIRKTDYITVYPYPTPQFTSNVALACAPANIQFTDQSTAGQGGITSWSWDLGDGATSNQQNPAHSYSQTGYYNVTLKITNSNGCSNTVTRSRYLRVVEGIQPNFKWDQTSAACSAPYLLNFTNQTAGPGALTFSWNLGNGASPAASTDTSPANISYAAPGSYNVSLQVSSSLGCTGSVQKTVPLSNSNAVFTSPDQGCVNVPITFTNGSTPPPTSVAWDFGDGSASADPNPTKTYTTNGTYTVKLTNTYTSCTSSATKTVIVANPPTPAFIADKTISCNAPFTVQFTDKTTPAATQWLWDFGDGQTSTGQNPSHTYIKNGSFDVKLTITNTGGCSNSTTQSKLITVQPPAVALADPDALGACVSSSPTFFTVLPTLDIDAVDGVQSISWSAPNATPSTATGTNPSFTYATPGAYTLITTVTTTGGCSVTNTFSGVVHIGTPTTPVITSPGAVCGSSTITFTDPQTPATEYQWRWNFGDGTDTLTNLPSIDHSYSNIGIKPVTLTLIHNGCPQVVTNNITVNPPIAGFSYKTADCSTNKYQIIFTDTSKLGNASIPPAPPVNFAWDFGDGNTSTVENATHIYPTATATYPVTLTVTEGNGCSSTVTTTIAVGPIPVSFTPPTQACWGGAIPLTATTADPTLITGYFWYWDDDKDKTFKFTTSPSTTLSNPNQGNHIIVLVFQQANGCIDSTKRNIQITHPTASIGAPPAGACKNSDIAFTGIATPDPVTNDPITLMEWDFGDGTNSRAQNPTHAYTDTGFFRPIFSVIDAAGCSFDYHAPDLIHITSPFANFGGPDSFYCPKTALVFKDSSLGLNLTNNWDYGDATSDITGIHTYANNQIYNVTLTVTDQFACTNALTKPVRIQQPIAAFDITDTTAICAPLQTKFIAHGQFYDSLYWDFGDGSTSTLPTTSHFYNTTDTFYAKLFLQGPGGCLDSATRRVLVLDPQSTTKFTFTPASACDSVLAQFDITPPGYTRFTLVFGDRTSDSSQNTKPFHIYRSPTTYAPSLSLLDATGCIVSIGAPPSGITVLGSVPFMSLDPHAFCDSSVVTFTDYTITNDGIVSETLDFGDGTTPQTHSTGSADFNTDHFYTKPGTWLATLKVITNNNCSELYTDTIRVHQTPHPVIAINSELCTGLIQFNGNITDPQAEPISWSWDFGNGASSKDQNPTVDFKSGTYTVKLQASVPFGCKDTTSKPITVFPLPEIKGPHEISTAVGIPVTIPLTYSDNVNAWAWTPVDHLDCSNCGAPTATLIFAQLYHVKVTDANNCSSTDSILIKTICNENNYFLPNTFSPNNDGVNDYFYPRGSNLYNIQSLKVFNRWGQLVFERRNFPANAATMGWDGTFNGKPAPVDAYIYIAEVICDNAQVVALHGDVALIR